MTDTSTQQSEGVWDRLRRRKVVQWGLAYVAGAWGLLQGLEYVTGRTLLVDETGKSLELALSSG